MLFVMNAFVKNASIILISPSITPKYFLCMCNLIFFRTGVTDQHTGLTDLSGVACSLIHIYYV